MSYREFLYQIEAQVKDRMGKEAQICIHSVVKNNSIVLDGLSILEQGDNVSPAIYLNGFYQEYLAGETIEKIVSRILAFYQRGRKIRKMDISFYTDPEKARKRVVCRVINQEKNHQLLREIPWRPFLNLAVVYYYLLEQEELGAASILIRKEHLQRWGREEEELHKTAVHNMKILQPYQFLSMTEMIYSMTGSEEILRERIPLYVLTNRERYYGAVWMTDPAVLWEIGERLGQDYYVLPSSIHECMVVPAQIQPGEEILKEMVREINATQVEPEEVLEDTIYYYNREKEMIQLV